MRLKSLILRSENSFNNIKSSLPFYLTYFLNLILLNYQPIIVRIGLNDSPASPARKSTRDYILLVFPT